MAQNLITKFGKAGTLDTENRTVEAVISTDELDRDNEVVVQKGIKYENYLKNPTVLAEHIPAILTQIGEVVSIRQLAKQTTAKIKFAAEGVSETADAVWRMVEAGLTKALSIGYRVLKASPLPDGARSLDEIELLEVSFVPIPANQSALVKGLSYENIDTYAKLLANDDNGSKEAPATMTKQTGADEKAPEQANEPVAKTYEDGLAEGVKIGLKIKSEADAPAPDAPAEGESKPDEGGNDEALADEGVQKAIANYYYEKRKKELSGSEEAQK